MDDRLSWSSLAMRPLIIRLGLRDVIDPDFASAYDAGLVDRPKLVPLLDGNSVNNGIAALPKHLSRRLQSIPTDFTRSDAMANCWILPHSCWCMASSAATSRGGTKFIEA